MKYIEILDEFEAEGEKYGKDGNAFYDYVNDRIKELITEDRPSVILFIQAWLHSVEPGLILIAVILIGNYLIYELKADLEQLKKDIIAGKLLQPIYLRWVDKSIDALNKRQ